MFEVKHINMKNRNSNQSEKSSVPSIQDVGTRSQLRASPHTAAIFGDNSSQDQSQ